MSYKWNHVLYLASFSAPYVCEIDMCYPISLPCVTWYAHAKLHPFYHGWLFGGFQFEALRTRGTVNVLEHEFYTHLYASLLGHDVVAPALQICLLGHICSEL